jgi:hypothetical protein
MRVTLVARGPLGLASASNSTTIPIVRAAALHRGAGPASLFAASSGVPRDTHRKVASDVPYGSAGAIDGRV